METFWNVVETCSNCFQRIMILVVFAAVLALLYGVAFDTVPDTVRHGSEIVSDASRQLDQLSK